jgi:hypothetical protein
MTDEQFVKALDSDGITNSNLSPEGKARLRDISNQLKGCSTILRGLQENARHLVEELENEFDLYQFQLPPEIHERFLTMRSLITQVPWPSESKRLRRGEEIPS